VNRTIETYDRIAADYAERTWNLRVKRALISFARYLIPGGLALDLGCGPGRDIALLRQQGVKAVGADLSTGMLHEAHHRVGGPLLCADMCALPIASESFDGVWMCASLLHLPRKDVPRGLAEVRRILRAKGVLYVSVQQGTGEKWSETHGTRLFTYYQADELAALVRPAGFAIQEDWVNQDDRRKQIQWISLIALAS
jgi:ubiquinone/menaquinone biosynthesis C-methylase UbiE